ncbi:MAG: substrate-binding domain-containing protein [Vicinamibacteria bacterium]|nr:substrate-binding domain-containing protein [Vicinamibacteria bacterium]
MRGSLALVLIAVASLPVCGAEPAVRVRADDVASGCLVSALKADAGRGALTGAADAADVLVATAAEVTRAVESGAAVEGSEVAIARIPFVLVVPAGNPLGLRGLEDVARAGGELAVSDLPAAHEARRAAESAAPGRVRPTSAARVRSATLALVPLSLAGAGDRIATELRPLEIRGAVLATARDPQTARELLRRLAAAPAQDAFAACR